VLVVVVKLWELLDSDLGVAFGYRVLNGFVVVVCVDGRDEDERDEEL
jgi:hypothetical protein